jgi:hypothetical protein
VWTERLQTLKTCNPRRWDHNVVSKRPEQSTQWHGFVSQQNRNLLYAATSPAHLEGNTRAQKSCGVTNKYKGKGHPITGHHGPRGGVEVTLYSFSTSALGGGGCSAPRPGHFTPGKDPVPIYRRLGGPQGRSGRVRKISPPPGIDPGPSSPLSLYRLSYPAQTNKYRWRKHRLKEKDEERKQTNNEKRKSKKGSESEKQ